MGYLIEGLFWVLFHSIFFACKFICAFFIIIWTFELNPVLKRGTRDGYYNAKYDLKLKDWVVSFN